MEAAFTNDLIHETSPYLLQHAHNPVHWQAWHERVWQQANEEYKPVIVSIGYSSCHWCHVMEHESFEDEEVAAMMNEHFICIKVDREERPDVDQIYMDACQLISGRGGWPLNAITLPDGRPIYVGMYFPKEQWKQVLRYFVDLWANKREEAHRQASQITENIRGMDHIGLPEKEPVFTTSDRDTCFEKINASWDYEHGGRSGAPKFAMPVILQYLLHYHFYHHHDQALDAVLVTLNQMMNGGIYDQLGGGFARYSVDDQWIIPHFEKMLYDNAQLVSVYANAYQITDNERYREVVYETLEFVERELSDESGGFYAALDADSEGEEGKYYLWSYVELKKILGDEFEHFANVFPVTVAGNFEGRNHLVRNGAAEIDPTRLKNWKEKLLNIRSKRIKPGLDHKILTSWNALMLKGYTDAYRAFTDEKFLQRALACAYFIKDKMILPDGLLMRNYHQGKANIHGFLDDYSFTCEAFLSLYEVTFDEQWLHTAQRLADYTVQHFYNAESKLFFYTDIDDNPLIARKTETSDNVLPASNSSMAKALYRLSIYLDHPEWMAISRQALSCLRANILHYPSYYANWASLADWFIQPPHEVVIAGKDAEARRAEMQKSYLPNCLFAGGTQPSDLPLLQDRWQPEHTFIYVCQNRVCQLPVTSVAEATKQII